MEIFKGNKLPKFADFLAWYIVTWLMCIFLMAIILPEKFATNPVVTQFTTMASNLLSFIVGFYWGGMHKKADLSNQSGTTEISLEAKTTNTDNTQI